MKEKIGFPSSSAVQIPMQTPWATTRAPSLKFLALVAALLMAVKPAGFSEMMSFAAFSCGENGGNRQVDVCVGGGVDGGGKDIS